MGKIVLYTTKLSPPGRAVELTAKALGLEDFEIRNINLAAGDHLTDDFIKLNPQHTIPTIIDGDIILWDSHAIIIYLVTKYGKDDSLYPCDPFLRAKVNQFLHFDSGVLFARARFLCEPVLYFGSTEFAADRVDYVQKSYKLLEDTLREDSFLVGNNLTVADLSVVSTLSTIVQVVPADPKTHPKLHSYFAKLVQLPYYKETNQEGVEILKGVVFKTLEENKIKKDVK